MKLAPAIVVASALALSLTPVASAKDLTQAQVCGQSGCAALPRDKDGDGLVQLRGSEGRRVVAPPKPAAYYLLVWEFGPPAEDGQTVRFATLYAPSTELVAAPGMKPGSIEWFGASEAVLEKVRSSVRDLDPFAAPAQWPATISPPTYDSPATTARPSEGRDWWRWAFLAAVAFVVVAVAASLARRLRPSRLRAA